MARLDDRAKIFRNQLFPLTTLTGFSYAGVERNTSPLNVRARLRPSELIFADVRLNYDTRYHNLRDLVFGGGLTKNVFSLPVSVSQNWYYTRRIAVDELREQVPFDPSTLPGNQFDFSGFVGSPARGPYGGFTVLYDLRDKEFSGIARDRRMIALVTSAGWAWDCCSLQLQSFTFNAGLRNESRYIFSFTLKGIGTFGTENIGQRRQ
jgi:LPS-assembly protein